MAEILTQQVLSFSRISESLVRSDFLQDSLQTAKSSGIFSIPRFRTAAALSLRQVMNRGSKCFKKMSLDFVNSMITFNELLSDAMELIASYLTLHFTSSFPDFRIGIIELMASTPKASPHRAAAQIAPCLTYWLSSLDNSRISGRNFWYTTSRATEPMMFPTTEVIWVLMFGQMSFPRVRMIGNKRFSLSPETIFTNLFKDFVASIFTSFSTSFKRVLKVWIRLRSVISLPKLSAISLKFLERASLTLHDLSSADWIMTGNVWVLFQSRDKTLANAFNESRHKTLTRSCSSVDNCLNEVIKSLMICSFSYTKAISPILVAITLLTIGVSSFESSLNLLNNPGSTS